MRHLTRYSSWTWFVHAPAGGVESDSVLWALQWLRVQRWRNFTEWFQPTKEI